MRISSVGTQGLLVLAVALGVGACDSKEGTPSSSASSSSASSSTAPSAALAAAPSAHQLASYVGHFEGKYDAKRFRLEMTPAQGAVKQWADDDGQALSGTGSIALDIGEDKRITGTSTGPLGTLRASGLLDEGRVSVALVPDHAVEPAAAVGATLLGTLEGDRLVGSLQASTGDSLKVRRATVELERKAGASIAASRGDSTGKK